MTEVLACDFLVCNSCCAHSAFLILDLFHEIWKRATHHFPQGIIPQDKVTNGADKLPFFLANEKLDFRGRVRRGSVLSGMWRLTSVMLQSL